MNLFAYDPVDRSFVRQFVARVNPAFGDEDPDQPEFLIPASCTPKEPPQSPSGQAAQFNPSTGEDGDWVLVPDIRGTVGYDSDGEAQIVTILGVTLADLGLTVAPPPPPPQKILEDKIQARRIAIAQAAVQTDLGTTFGASDQDRNTMAQLILAAQITGVNNCQWTFPDGTTRQITLIEVKQAFTKAVAKMIAINSAP